jgi:hypothetical protein
MDAVVRARCAPGRGGVHGLVRHAARTAPSLHRRLDEENSIEFFESVLYERSTVALLAKFAHEVLEIFYATPLFRMAD